MYIKINNKYELEFLYSVAKDNGYTWIPGNGDAGGALAVLRVFPLKCRIDTEKKRLIHHANLSNIYVNAGEITLDKLVDTLKTPYYDFPDLYLDDHKVEFVPEKNNKCGIKVNGISISADDIEQFRPLVLLDIKLKNVDESIQCKHIEGELKVGCMKIPIGQLQHVWNALYAYKTSGW
jgi:hypothetical protein